MKRHLSGAILVCLSLLLTTAPVAARDGGRLKAQVPFDFYVGDTLVSAGEYTVQEVTRAGDALSIRKADGSEGAIVLTNELSEDGRERDSVRLVFRRYGDRFFLAQVRTPGNDRSLAPSKAERRLRRELRAAKLQDSPEVLEVAAHYAR